MKFNTKALIIAIFMEASSRYAHADDLFKTVDKLVCEVTRIDPRIQHTSYIPPAIGDLMVISPSDKRLYLRFKRPSEPTRPVYLGLGAETGPLTLSDEPYANTDIQRTWFAAEHGEAAQFVVRAEITPANAITYRGGLQFLTGGVGGDWSIAHMDVTCSSQ